MLVPARKAELNERTREEDRLGVGPSIYLSTLLLCNVSIVGLYFIFKNESLRRSIKIPVFCLVFSVASYKLTVEWSNR
jgi:hypothetical protein